MPSDRRQEDRNRQERQGSRELWTFLGFAAAVLGLVAFASLIASCSIVRAVLGEEPAPPAPRPFNHAAHLERGLDCLTCHETAERSERAGMPSKELCMGCHEEIDADPRRPLEQKVAWFLDAGGAPAWSAFTKQSEEVRFSHASHAAKKVSCAACHAEIEKSAGLLPGMAQPMSSCVACHERGARGKSACSDCHRVLDRTVAPPNHARMWMARHGEGSRTGRGAANDCAMCHQRNECSTCHQARAPADHTMFWRLRGHGAAASVSRERCATCHAGDSCDRCHQETAPLSHTGGWACPKSQHCTSCHLPLASSGSCAVCHRSTPGHGSAPARPAWHNASMNCRSCHASSLKHPDNGDDCNACHQ